jgi:hypothetical protein
VGPERPRYPGMMLEAAKSPYSLSNDAFAQNLRRPRGKAAALPRGGESRATQINWTFSFHAKQLGIEFLGWL